MLLKNDFLFFLIFRENDESVNKAQNTKNKKKLSHLSLYDLLLSLIIEGSEKGVFII